MASTREIVSLECAVRERVARKLSRLYRRLLESRVSTGVGDALSLQRRLNPEIVFKLHEVRVPAAEESITSIFSDLSEIAALLARLEKVDDSAAE